MRPDEVNVKILEGLTGKAREDFLVGLKALNMDDPSDREALRKSIRRARPDFTEAQVDIFVEGKVKPDTSWKLTEAVDQEREDFIAQVVNAYRVLNPGASEDDVAKWVRDNEKRVRAKREEEGFGTHTISQLVSALLQDDKEKAKAQEIPDALAARYPEWSAEKRAAWLKKNEALLLAYKGLHGEWSGSQLVTAIAEPEDK